MWRTLLSALAAVVLLAGCGSTQPAGVASSPAAHTRATIGLTYIPNVQFAPAYLALDEHKFEGVDVTLRHHGAQEGLFTALTSGQEDFAIAGGDELMQARAQGMDLVAVAGYYSRYPAEVIARSDTGIKTLGDLRGKNIGVPGRFGESWFGLLVALQSAGLQQSDVTVTEIGYTGQAALTTKKVDAIIGFSNNDAVQLKSLGTAITEIPVASDVPLVSSVVVTTGAMVREHPDTVRGVARGMVAGMQRTSTSPDAAIKATKTRVSDLAQPEQERAARTTLEATIPLFADASGQVTGKLSERTWTKMSSFMAAQKLTEHTVPAGEAMTTQFV